MNNLSYVLTRDAAIELFADCIMPMVVHAYEFDGHPDWIARTYVVGSEGPGTRSLC